MNDYSSNSIINFPTSRLALEKIQSEWREFDLEGRRSVLDAQAQAISSGQDMTKESRKILADKGKEFQHFDREERFKNFPTLLTSYQKEIDRLTSHCKFACSAFFQIYKSLATISDPFPGLTTAVNFVGQKNSLGKLQQKNAGLAAQLAALQAQCESAGEDQEKIRHLELQLEHHKHSFEENLARRLAEVEQRLSAEQQERYEVFQASEQDHKLRLQQSVEEMTQLQIRHEATQSQLFAVQSKHAQDMARKQEDIDRLSEELASLRSKRRQLGAAEDSGGDVALNAAFNPRVKSLEELLAVKDESIQVLSASLQNAQEQISAVEERLTRELGAVQGELAQERSKVGGLQAQLDQAPTRTELHRLSNQLEILTSIHQLDISIQDNDTTETLLKRLVVQSENQIVKLNSQYKQLETQFSQVQSDFALSKTLLEERDRLIANLEEALESIKSESPTLDDSTARHHAAFSEDSPRGADPMLQIVCRQRDRFKTRIETLEAEITLAQDLSSRLKIELETLRNDNIKLSQRIRYLESYNSKRSPNDSGNRPRFQGDVEAQKYQDLYQSSLDPFQEFSKNALSSKFKHLSVAEKCAFYTGKFLTANVYTRTFIFGYTVLLHLLVYALLRY